MLKGAISLFVAGAIFAAIHHLIGIWFRDKDAEVSVTFIRAISFTHFLGRFLLIAGTVVLVAHLAIRIFSKN